MELQALETYSDTIAKIVVPLVLICWLAYLSVDQFYFFADNEQLISDLESSQSTRAATNNPTPIKLVRLHSISSESRVKRKRRRSLLLLRHG